MMTISRCKYIFKFCQGVEFTALAAKTFDKRTRLCYISTEQFRMYLCGTPDGFALSFFKKDNNQWLCVRQSTRLQEFAFAIPSSEEELVDCLLRVFYIQFPEASETYWDFLPTMRVVMEMLYLYPTVSEMEYHHFKCITDLSVEVDDADGIATLICSDGSVMVPFDKVSADEKYEYIFQADRALEHPDCGAIIYSIKKLANRVSSWRAKIVLSPWIRLREFLDAKENLHGNR